MKKLISLTILLLSLFLMASCQNESISCGPGENDGKYKLTVEDEYHMLIEELSCYYDEGDTVIVKTGLVMDANVVVELNGARSQNHFIAKDENGRYSHTEWEFVMPAKDSILEITISSGMDAIYYRVGLSDPNNLVVNDLAGMYTPGETVKIKTQTSKFENSNISFTANNLYVKYEGETKNENGELLYHEWSFVMPHEDVIVSAVLSPIEYYLNVQDERDLLQNNIIGYYKIGAEIEIHLNTGNVLLFLNEFPLDLSLEEVLDENNQVLYYKQAIKMPDRQSTLRVEPGEPLPSLHNLVFIDETPYKMFETDYSGEYAAGEKITITSNSDVLDAEVILKANGIKIEEIGYDQWQFIMPHKDVTIKAYLINTSWGDNWHYLNVEDKELLLVAGVFYDRLGVVDGYYQEEETITLYSRALLILEADCEINVLDYLYIESRGIYEYKFIMPEQDITLKISQLKNE
ncbi:MAG: hypothetical protein E7596_01625 [Ruminococcaceae bacterium]|nr:hypothetical protein [Oscillospiraceae bacterium]